MLTEQTGFLWFLLLGKTETKGATAMSISEILYHHAFAGYRTPCSQEYRAGVLAALKFRLGEAEDMPLPYTVGTAQADAWFAGTNEGHRIARDHLAIATKQFFSIEN